MIGVVPSSSIVNAPPCKIGRKVIIIVVSVSVKVWPVSVVSSGFCALTSPLMMFFTASVVSSCFSTPILDAEVKAIPSEPSSGSMTIMEQSIMLMPSAFLILDAIYLPHSFQFVISFKCVTRGHW